MRTALIAFVAANLIAGANAADPPVPNSPPPNPVHVDADGTVHVPPIAIPVSEYLSPEGKAYMAEHLNDMQNPQKVAPGSDVPPFLAGYLKRQQTLYPVEQQDTSIAGVHAFIYKPKAGIAAKNANRVLINLHGGGFMGCWPACGQLESIPVSSLAQIEVISLDYREGPKYQFPAASEDVATVYKELLKTHRPENIGIYGCSAGGMLTGMSMAWFQSHGLPKPGAIAILCAGLTMTSGFGGDANYISVPAGEARMPFVPPPSAGGDKKAPRGGLPYFANADLSDPLVSPAVSPDVLAKFPPTLFVTATRGMELSSTVYSHSRLVKAGVETDLHVWEGLFHGFFYNPDVPESRDCYDVIVNFFDHHLGN